MTMFIMNDSEWFIICYVLSTKMYSRDYKIEEQEENKHHRLKGSKIYFLFGEYSMVNWTADVSAPYVILNIWPIDSLN